MNAEQAIIPMVVTAGSVQPPWIVQAMPVSGEWFALYEDDMGRWAYPIVAWVVEETDYQGRKHRDIVGYVAAHGYIKSAQDAGRFQAYSPTTEGWLQWR